MICVHRSLRVIHSPTARSGFSLTELLVAMMVLAVGLLAMAAGTGWMIRMVDNAQLDTERSVALQAGIERVKATPFNEVADGSFQEGPFTISWQVAGGGANDRLVRFQVSGPGRATGAVGAMPAITRNAVTEFEYRLVRP